MQHTIGAGKNKIGGGGMGVCAGPHLPRRAEFFRKFLEFLENGYKDIWI